MGVYYKPGIVVRDESCRVVLRLHEAVVVLGEARVLLEADARAPKPVGL